MPSRRHFYDFFGGHTIDLHDVGQLLNLVFSREQRIASEQLSYDGTETPHVDGGRVWDAQDNFRRSVKP